MANGNNGNGNLNDKSKEQLIEIIESLKKRKKFGIVWEAKPEDLVVQCRKQLPVLEEATDKAISKFEDGTANLIIEGDNYHALSVLNYTHAGKIDVIYIDPPYNTGAKDWKYNNDYVDENDAWRHSKWLAMMANRLRLAEGLLSKNGVLIITIDDNEACTLGLLLEEIFPNKERATVVIKYNPAGTARNGFSRTHEYAYFMLNPGQEIEKKAAPPDIRDQNLRRHGSGANRKDSPTMFYPIYVDKKTMKVIGTGDVPPDDFHPAKQMIEKAKNYEIWPLDDKDKEKRWYYGKERVQSRGHEELICKWVRGRLHVYFHTDNESEQKYQSVWVGSEYDSGAHGGSLVRDIVGHPFPFPKSINAVKDCLNAIIRNKKDAFVLDFFAGSGTTGHAVLELNRNDGGNRKFILCTNNEGGIAEDITYPRIKNVIGGYGEVAGIPANLRYFKTAFVDGSEVSDDTRRELVKRSAEMICVKEDTYKKVRDNKDYKIFRNDSQATGILFNLEEVDAFKKHLKELKLPAHLYIFSLSNDTFDKEFENLELKHRLCLIPESILEVYRKLFKD